jgi:D-alanyl-D-alanine dipeptidase
MLARICGGVEGAAALGHGRSMLIPITARDGILLDLRYASVDNLLGRAIYSRAVALLLPVARDALLKARDHAGALGLKLKLFDAFRPLEAQWAFWHAATDKTFVADPRGGGTHPRGIAVDITLVEGASGLELPMGTGFDDFSARSAHGCLADLSAEAIRNRALLLGVMTACGFEHYAPEWWHYHLPGRDAFPALSAADVPDGPMEPTS